MGRMIDADNLLKFLTDSINIPPSAGKEGPDFSYRQGRFTAFKIVDEYIKSLLPFTFEELEVGEFFTLDDGIIRRKISNAGDFNTLVLFASASSKRNCCVVIKPDTVVTKVDATFRKYTKDDER